LIPGYELIIPICALPLSIKYSTDILRYQLQTVILKDENKTHQMDFNET
jgi:hypothetical protein